jgi:hypothetical protein
MKKVSRGIRSQQTKVKKAYVVRKGPAKKVPKWKD